MHGHSNFFGGCDFCKKKVESTRGSLTPIKSYCPDTTVGQLRLDPILLGPEVMEDEAPLMQTNAPETQGVILGKSKINIYNYKHDHIAERPQNTTNTIRLEVIPENFQICDLNFCVDSLKNTHILQSCLRSFH